MKARRVIVTIELTSDRSIDRIKLGYGCPVYFDNIHQVQVNVVKPEKEKK